MDLAKLARPWTHADGDIPSVSSRIEDIIGRISLFSTDGTSVLRLWDPQHEPLDVQLPSGTFAVALTPVSRTPIESGYLECMHLAAAADGIPAADAIGAFTRMQQERYADMEQHLVDCYGTLTPEREVDPRFRGIDYPAFDLGPVKLGLGLLAEHARHRPSSIWCWSRVVNWHK